MVVGGVNLKFLGIDGGGTKTEFMLINEEGKILGHVDKPTCHYKQTSLQNFKEIITDGVNELCKKSNITISQIDYSLIGIPGYGEILEDIHKIDTIIENIFKPGSYRSVNDAVVAWAGSLGCNPGINIVAGTGTIGFGIDKSDNSARVGGWGHFCGDEGSAFWLGKKLIEIFSKESDGRLDRTPLYDILRNKLEITRDFDLIDLVITEYAMEREKIAKLAMILYEAANEGDKIAQDIFSQAAYEHYLIIKSIMEKLDFPLDEKIIISYSGGVFNSGKYILEPLKNYLKELDGDIELSTPILKPVTGAALYAYNLFSLKNNIGIIDRLRKEELEWNII